MSPELSRRLGAALGTKYVAVADRRLIEDAAAQAEVWQDLSEPIRALVQDIESRGDPWPSGQTEE